MNSILGRGEDFSLGYHFQTASGIHPVRGYQGFFPCYNAAYCSLPSSVEVKNMWNYTFTFFLCLHGMVLN
jgi:hypothetical protein